jgi:hypothetical protein
VTITQNSLGPVVLIVKTKISPPNVYWTFAKNFAFFKKKYVLVLKKFLGNLFHHSFDYVEIGGKMNFLPFYLNRGKCPQGKIFEPHILNRQL